jgi:hypothetical protein
MDTNNLINDAKIRFAHNSAKAYLKDKYVSRLKIAEQNGLWTASPELIAYLKSVQEPTAFLIDEYDSPLKIDVQSLLARITETYNQVMSDWHTEWSELEKQR